MRNAKNILKQKFNPAEPNKVWFCDFTYIRAAGRFYYLCAIIDLFSRKVIAFKLSNKMDTNLAIKTVNQAVAARGKSTGIIFHTDRSCQFTSSVFRRLLDNLNMIQSFSAKGYPYDNVVMESFFKYLKKEEMNLKTYSSFDDLHIFLFKYINEFYNSVRPHSHNNGLSPISAEKFFIFSHFFLSTLLTMIKDYFRNVEWIIVLTFTIIYVILRKKCIIIL